MALSSIDFRKLVTPNSTALIVIDKQYGYFERDGTNVKRVRNALPLIDDFIQQSRNAGVAVYWTKMLENIDDSPPTIQYVMNHDNGYVDLTRKNNKSYEIIGLQPREGESIIEKRYYNAFNKTNLESSLRENGIDTVILVGGYASRCILATAASALDRDFKIVIPEELVANSDNYWHEVPATFSIVNAIYGHVVPVSRFKDAWSTSY
jgi:nicotinamidase-related amidase